MAVSKLLKAKKVVKGLKKPGANFDKILGDTKQFKKAIYEIQKVGGGTPGAKGYMPDNAPSNVWDVTSTQRRILSTAKKEQKVLYKKAKQELGMNPEDVKIQWGGNGLTRKEKLGLAGHLGKGNTREVNYGLKNKSAYELRKYGQRLLGENFALARLLKVK